MQGNHPTRPKRILVVGTSPGAGKLAVDIRDAFSSRVSTLAASHFDAMAVAESSRPTIVIIEGPFRVATSGWAAAATLRYFLQPDAPLLIALANGSDSLRSALETGFFHCSLTRAWLFQALAPLTDRRRVPAANAGARIDASQPARETGYTLPRGIRCRRH